jgi:ribosome-binding factor A
MNERRLARLTQQIKQRLAEVLQRDIADPKLGMVTITRVELDTEFTQCKAYWSVLAGSDQEEKAKRDSAAVLNRARGFCQREMAKILHTRSVPHLQFLFDEGIGAAIRMNKILSEISTGSAAKPEAQATDESSPETDPASQPETDGGSKTDGGPATDSGPTKGSDGSPPAAE